MKAPLARALLAIALLCAPSLARALCSYDGVDNARTTLAQEFRDSRWVARVRVISANDHWSDTGDSWTRYRIEVVQAFKGAPPRRMTFFTYRDSGGFYMDRPWMDLPKGHDIGGEYLLFLQPSEYFTPDPPEAKGTVFVNYNCGQSKAWSEVSPADRARLDALSVARR